MFLNTYRHESEMKYEAKQKSYKKTVPSNIKIISYIINSSKGADIRKLVKNCVKK